MMGIGPRRFVRSTNVAGDIKTFDVGKLFVISNNETGTTAIGKLWFEYDFEFFIPQNSPSGSSTSGVTSMYLRAAVSTYSTGVAADFDMDAASFDPLGFGVDASGLYTPAAGIYRIAFQASFRDSSAELFAVQIVFNKNGSPITGALSNMQYTATASGAMTQSLEHIVTLNGTDTFSVSLTLTGAAGTLTVIANTSRLLINLA